LKSMLLLSAVILLPASAAFSQPEEEAASAEDSLQTTEVAVPSETTDSLPAEIPTQPTPVLESFFLALKEGDSLMVSELVSEEALEGIDMMLDILKDNLDDDTETTLSRLTAAGYRATADEIDDWSAREYLTHTVVLPVMKARYSMYQMQIGDFTIDDDEIVVPLVFANAAGVELHVDATMSMEDDAWRVTSFMGLNSFP